MSRLWKITVVATLCFAGCCGYPGGAPSDACTSMQPGHGYGATTSIASSYSVTLSKTTYSPGDLITVTISGTAGASFKGFLVEMRKEANDDSTLGSWTTTTEQTVCNQVNVDYRLPVLIRCACTRQAGVTHTGSNMKISTQMQWTAPSSSVGNVQVWATIVQAFSTWTTIKSSVINPTTTTGLATTTSTTQAPSTSLQPSTTTTTTTGATAGATTTTTTTTTTTAAGATTTTTAAGATASAAATTVSKAKDSARSQACSLFDAPGSIGAVHVHVTLLSLLVTLMNHVLK